MDDFGVMLTIIMLTFCLEEETGWEIAVAEILFVFLTVKKSTAKVAA